MKHIFKCKNCNKFTMKEKCDCGGNTLLSKPLKYSQDDRLGPYRRKAKIKEYVERELL